MHGEGDHRQSARRGISTYTKEEAGGDGDSGYDQRKEEEARGDGPADPAGGLGAGGPGEEARSRLPGPGDMQDPVRILWDGAEASSERVRGLGTLVPATICADCSPSRCGRLTNMCCLGASELPYCPHGFCQGEWTLWQTLKTAGLWLARLCESFLVLSSLINLVYYYWTWHHMLSTLPLWR